MGLAALKEVKSSTQLNSRDAVGEAQRRLRERISGQESVIELALCSFVAGGHLLLEGPPGVGKTSLARHMAEVFAGSFRRIQMTSDLLPSEIVGILRPAQTGSDFEFRPGPIFANFLLIDELNRTSPKTQAALLEAMAEGHVTVDGKAYSLPSPYFVVATQNPHESHGVYPLAESQLDRFMLQVRVDLPDTGREIEIFKKGFEAEKKAAPVEPVVELEQILEIQAQASKIHFSDEVMKYFHTIVSATRTHSGIEGGVSIRGGLLMVSALRALAYMRNRDYVSPEDVQDLAVPSLAHRLTLENGSWEWEAKRRVVEDILSNIKPPK